VQQKYCCYDNQSGKSSLRHPATDLQISVELQSSRKPRHEELDIPHSSTTPKKKKGIKDVKAILSKKLFLQCVSIRKVTTLFMKKTENLV
jgi:hypothetical protein